MSSESEEEEEEKSPALESFESGLKLWDEGKIEEAISEFLRAGVLGFRRDAIENNIGAGYDKLGRTEEAIKHYFAALKDNPSNFFALKNIAEAFYSKEEWSRAKSYFGKALQINPEDMGIRIDFVRCLVKLDKIRKAVRAMKPLFEMNTDVSHMLDALTLLRDAEAFNEILRMKKLFPESLEESLEFQRIIGEAYLESGMTQEAIDSFKKIIAKNPDPLTKSWLGLAEISEGSEEGGLALLREAMNDDPENIQILRNMSFALHGSDRLEEALLIYEKAVKVQPDEFVMWNNWGNALYNLGKFRESIPKFVMAIEKNPDYEIAWNNIGNALEKLKLAKEAVPFHLRALEINDEFDYAHYALAFTLLTIGSYDKAIVELEKALSLHPAFPEAWDLKAKTLMDSLPDQAIEYARHAIELNPESAEAVATLAMCQMKSGMGAEAEKTLRRARGLAAENDEKETLKEIEDIERYGISAISKIQHENGLLPPEAAEGRDESRPETHDAIRWYKLGSELLLKGKRKKALDSYEIALELDPDSSASAYALLKVERDKARLSKYIIESRRIHSAGLATPRLESALDYATKNSGIEKD